MNSKELSRLLKKSVETGVLNAFSESSIAEDFITKNQAYAGFGRTCVDRWLKEGLLLQLQHNGKPVRKCIDRNKLFAIAARSNRTSYLPVAERC